MYKKLKLIAGIFRPLHEPYAISLLDNPYKYKRCTMRGLISSSKAMRLILKSPSVEESDHKKLMKLNYYNVTRK